MALLLHLMLANGRKRKGCSQLSKHAYPALEDATAAQLRPPKCRDPMGSPMVSIPQGWAGLVLWC